MKPGVKWENEKRLSSLTKFTQSAASWNDLARIGTGSKVELKLMVFLLVLL